MSVLEGVRVLDFGSYIAGPYCAAILSDLGADVIRVERIGGSDDRAIVPLVGDDDGGAMYLQVNRNKRSMTLDPRSPSGRNVMTELVATADVVVANLPDGVLRSLGLDYTSLRTVKSDIIMTSISTFGSVGPWSDRVGFDGTAQAMSGLVHLSGTPGAPSKFYGHWVDVGTAAYAAVGTMGALLWRNTTGQGQHVQGSLLGTALTVAAPVLVEQSATGVDRESTGNRAQTVGPSDLFRTTDGWIFVQVASARMFQRWAELVGADDFIGDERFGSDRLRGENSEVLSDVMAAWCRQRSTAEALDELGRARIPAGPVLTPRQVLEHDQVRATGMLKDVEYPGLDGPAQLIDLPLALSETPGGIRSSPPSVGEHTGDVLRELGYDDPQIAEFRRSGVI